jgi:hypothetical protein
MRVIWHTNSNLYQRKKSIRTMYHIENFVDNFCTPHSQRFWTLLSLVWLRQKSQDALMVTIGESSMASAHILPTTPNKLFWRALCKGGAQSMSSFFQSILLSHWFLRCTAPQFDLNQTEGVTHTELLVCELELGVLWDGWGIVGDIVVRLLLPLFSFSFL